MKKKSLVLIIFLSLLLCNGFTQSLYTLKNQKMEFSIDNKGNLVTLKNLQTGFNYAAGKPMWRLYFDRKNEKDIEVLADNNQPAIQQTGNQILMVYNVLKARGRNLNYKLSLKITLEENTVRFSSEIANNELHTIIRELHYPLVANCQIPPDHQLLTTYCGGQLFPDPKKKIFSVPYSYLGPDQEFRQMSIKYPTRLSSNCFALVGKSQGLYFGSHDSTFQDTWHGLRLYPDEKNEFTELETGLYKYPNCISGDSWKNDANIIAPYSGDWHETSKIYRKWANTWWDHQEEPQWVKQMLGFQRIIMRHQYGETLFTYKDFATRVKDVGESVGINAVFPFGWWNSGMDNGYPDSYFVTDPDQGGDKALKKAIADYKQDGGKVILYYNGKLIDTESEYYKNGDGKKVIFKSNTGTDMSESYLFSGHGTFTGYHNSRTFVVADTKNPKWHLKLVEMADHAYEFGANSIFYDQMGSVSSGVERTGFWNTGQEFPIPELRIVEDKAKALKKLHEYIDKKDKEMAIGIESITDVTSQYVDYVHSILNLEQESCFVDWFRYTFPEIILTDRYTDGAEKDIEWLVNQTVLLGLRNNVHIYRLRALIDETPRYQKHLAKTIQLKKKYSSLLLSGTYRDTEGFSSDNEEMEARSFVNENQLAIVVTHKSDEEATSDIVVPGYRYQESSGVGDTKVIFGTDNMQSVTIGKNGLMVLIYNKN
jgi:Domain of unknown function (DUF6259)